MGAVLKKTGRVILAAAAALLLLNVVCFVYFNRPSHAASLTGATDYTWEPRSAYFDMTEGFAFNRTNNEGYFNPYDYEQGMDIDVLILGASQMQSSSVQMKDSAPVLLSEKLGGARVYNLGMAGHLFPTLVQNMDAALNAYKPDKYVVIELETVIFSDETLISILDGTVEEMESYSGGLVNLLQRVDVLRLMYSQLSSYLESHGGSAAQEDATQEEPLAARRSDAAPMALAAKVQRDNSELLREVLAKVKRCADSHGVQPIILFDPKAFFSPEGWLWFGMAPEAELFASMCRDEGIIFVNMCPRFNDEFIATSSLPYGFTNTSKGEGHLNATGHAIIADELYKAMTAEEK